MNRIATYINQETPDESQPVARDYWIVRCREGPWFAVRAPQAARIQRALEKRRIGKWTEFRDIAGSRIRVRTDEIVGMHECTEVQRARDRRQSRYLEREHEKDGGPWG
jgi:hypothetical protein